MEESTSIKRRFNAYRNTHLLWETDLEGMTIFKIPNEAKGTSPVSSSSVRIGKLVEEFVQFDLAQNKDVQVLASNHQVIDEQQTLGELDCLLKLKDANVHLEIVYKFYLYDPAKEGEINRWVGPSQKDSLVQKLDKLKNKQMPLLYHQTTASLLNELGLSAADFEQRVCFKAQLFVPYSLVGTTFSVVNNECIQGFYLNKEDLAQFEAYEFFVPSKIDWLIDAHDDVDWMSIGKFKIEVTEGLTNEKSPLCWMKSPEGELQRFFLVWWS